jgi:hypothetical protein
MEEDFANHQHLLLKEHCCSLKRLNDQNGRVLAKSTPHFAVAPVTDYSMLDT